MRPLKNTLFATALILLPLLAGCGMLFNGLAPKYTTDEKTSISTQREITNLSVIYTTFSNPVNLLIPFPTIYKMSFAIRNPTEDDFIQLQKVYDRSFSGRVDTFRYLRRSDGNHGEGETYLERGLPERISEMIEPVLYVYLENERFGDRDPLGTLNDIIRRLPITLSHASAATYEKIF